ncbi:uncharacterized protein LOC119693791 [Plutella xylostella]|uniref:uncharacterized protein LOC119693791 n=1 Tax=Plutella xylostella TaxID=51655 RepID=UPI00203252FD|nr:uncharacterized protein LOC119693791 [Plutella xylostella]
MAASRRLVVTLVVCLLGDVFSLPFESRLRRGAVDNEVDSADQILGEASPAKDVADSVSTSNGYRLNFFDVRVATAAAPGGELSKKNEDLNEAPPPPEVIQDIFGVPSDTPSDPSATLPSITEIKYEDAKNQYEASPAPASDEDDDDDDDDAFEFESMETSPTLGVGSNIFSLLSLANSLFGGSSGGGAAPAPTEAPSILQSIWNLKLDIIRALFSASTGILGAASASSSG